MNTFCLTHRIILATKVLLPWIGILVAATVFTMLPAEGSSITISGTGQTLVSTTPTPVYRTVSGSANLSISGTTLTVVLANTSPTNTTDPAEVLSSFYFDIVRGSQRPTLDYLSAGGQVYKLIDKGPDIPYVYNPRLSGTASNQANTLGTSNLIALNTGDGTWQFKPMTVTASPFLGFGIGTVGNTVFSGGSNGFDTDLVGKGNSMGDYSIYRGGDIQPNGNLKNGFFVQNSATFTFGIRPNGIAWTNADIRKEAVFGFGTNPDGIITVLPEPSAYALALLGAAAVLCRYRFRRKGRIHPAPSP